MQSMPDQPAPQKHWTTLCQLVVSGLGMLLSLLAAGSLVIFGIFDLLDGSIDPTGASSMFSTAWISLLAAIIAIPSLFYCYHRLRNSQPWQPKINSFRLASISLLLWPLVLLLGNMISTRGSLTWLFLPPLQLLAIGLPVWWIVEVARRRLSVGDPQRGWGIINFSTFITMPFLMLVEIVIILMAIVVFAIWISSQPGLLRELQLLAEQLVNSSSSPEEILTLLTPYLQNPLVILSALALIAGIVPLVEELIKPLAMWMLVRRRLTPAQGFVAGALCGASFALIESLFYLSSPMGESWAALAIGRTGTALLHTTNTAILGWAMAFAWQNHAYLRLGLIYLLTVVLHGLWNGLSILVGLTGALKNLPADLRFFNGITQAAPFVLAALVFSMFLLLWGSNRYLSDQTRLVTEPEPTPPAEIGRI